MKAPALEFMRPATVEEAVTCLAEGDGMARILAGGQSLVPMLNLRLAVVEALIDIGAISELREITPGDGHLRVGAATSHALIEDGLPGDPTAGMLAHVARDIAYRAVRNRGSIGGSLAHADPAADWPVALAALGATVEIAGPEGRRTLPVEDFSQDVFVTDLAEDEMLTAVLLPTGRSGLRWSYHKMRKKAGAFGEAIAAAVHDPDTGFSRVFAGSSALGGPQRLTGLEDALGSGGASADEIRESLAAIAELGRYEMQIHTVCLRRAIEEVSR